MDSKKGNPSSMISPSPLRSILPSLLTILLLAGAATAAIAQDTDELLYKRGVELYQAKQYEEALGVFENLRRNHPDSRKDDDALYYIGRIHRRQDRPEKAAEAFKQILSLSSTNRRVEAGYELGLIYYKNRDYQATVDLLEPLAKDEDLDNEDEDAVRLLGRSYYNLGILSKNAKAIDPARQLFFQAVATFEVLVEYSLSEKSRVTAMGSIGKCYDKLVDLAGDEKEAEDFRQLAIQWLERAIPLEDPDDAIELELLLQELRRPKAQPKSRTSGNLKLENFGGTNSLDLRPGLKLSADAAVTVSLADRHDLEIYVQYDHDGFDLKTFNFQDPTSGDDRLIQASDRIELGSGWHAGGKGALSSDLVFQTAYHFTADPEDTYLDLKVKEDLTYRINDPWKLTLDTTFARKTYPDYLINGRELDYLLAEAAPGVTWYLSDSWRAKLGYDITLKQYLNAKYDTAVFGVDASKNRRYLIQTVDLEFKRRPGAVLRPSAAYGFTFNKSYNYDVWVDDSAGPPGQFVEGYFDYLEHEISLGLNLDWSDRFQTDLGGSAAYKSFSNYPVRDATDSFTGELRRDWDLKADLEISYLFWPKAKNNFADLSLVFRGSYEQAISNMLYEEFFDTNYISIGAFAGFVIELP